MVTSSEVIQTTNREFTAESLRLLSVNEVRQILKLRYETVKLLIDEGKIEVIIIGKRIRIPAISLKKFIEENTVRLAEKETSVKPTNSQDFINNKIDSIIHKYKRSK